MNPRLSSTVMKKTISIALALVVAGCLAQTTQPTERRRLAEAPETIAGPTFWYCGERFSTFVMNRSKRPETMRFLGQRDGMVYVEVVLEREDGEELRRGVYCTRRKGLMHSVLDELEMIEREWGHNN